MNMHGERKGSCIAYMATIMRGGTRARPRLFWASPGFRRAHPDLYSCLSRAAKVTGSVWREVDMQTFARAAERNVAGPEKQHRNLQAIGVLLPSEKATLT